MAKSYKHNRWCQISYNYSILGKNIQQKTYLGEFKAPLHIICKLLHIFYGEQRIIKEFFTQLFLSRRRERLEGYYSNTRSTRSSSLSTTSSCRWRNLFSNWSRLLCFMGAFLCRAKSAHLLARCSIRALDQPDYWRIGGQLSRCLRIIFYLVTEILNLSLLLLRKVLNPERVRVRTRQLGII